MKTQRTSTTGFGLLAWLEQTQIHLPLKAIECRFQVCGAVVDVQLDQVFHQSAGRPLDVMYSFPLPSRAAVYRCEMIVHGRTIRAKVMEQEAARKMAAQKKAEGHRTGLVELERGNLFTLSLGNVQPDDVIIIRFAYVEELDAWEDEMALQIPFNPGVRYIPGKPLLRSNSGKGSMDDSDEVADASRISPPRIDRMHPDAAQLMLSGKLDGREVDLSSISSPTHPTAVRPSDGDFEIFLPANAAFPERDFVLRWRRASRSDLLPVAWVSSQEDKTYALIQLSAPDEVPGETRQGSDIYFLVDHSGSMAGEKWTKTVEALIAFVKATSQRDRIWITFFQSDYVDFAEKPLERDALLEDTNFQSIVRLGTDGGTELLPALRHILVSHERFSSARRSHIVLITDGQIGNEEAVLKEISGRALPVHSFGIDHAVNEAFLRELSGQQRGSSVFLTPNDDLVRPVAVLGSRLGRPVLTDLALGGGWELADTELPDIHASQVAFAPIRTMGNQSEITITGKGAAGQPLTVTFQAQAAGTGLPELIWMKRRIDSLLRDDKDEEAIALAEKANLVCRGAAFIAWDDAEKVAIAQDEVYQPSLEPCELMFSMPRPSVAAAPATFFGSKILEYGKAALAACSDNERVRELPSPQKIQELVTQVIEQVQLAFDREPAKALSTILEDWARLFQSGKVQRALDVLLRHCSRHGEPRKLRKALLTFFSNLPEPWQSEARPILGAIIGKAATK